MRWDSHPEAAKWTANTLMAVAEEDGVLASRVPADVAQWFVKTANAGEPIDQTVALDHVSVPGGDAPRDRDDRKALAQHAGTHERGFGHAQNRDVERFTQSFETRIAKCRQDHGVVLVRMFCGELGYGVGRDQGFEAGLDVGHSHGCGQHGDLRAGRGCQSGLFLDEGGDALGDVGVDDEQFHGVAVLGFQNLDWWRLGSRVGALRRRKRPPPARA